MVASGALDLGGLSVGTEADGKVSSPGHPPLEIRLGKGRMDSGTWAKRPVGINTVSVLEA
jgi:hypothetical protein